MLVGYIVYSLYCVPPLVYPAPCCFQVLCFSNPNVEISENFTLRQAVNLLFTHSRCLALCFKARLNNEHEVKSKNADFRDFLFMWQLLPVCCQILWWAYKCPRAEGTKERSSLWCSHIGTHLTAKATGVMQTHGTAVRKWSGTGTINEGGNKQRHTLKDANE